MPLLDVSDIVLDPDFADSFIVVTTTRAVQDNGQPVDTPGDPVTQRGTVIPNKSSMVRQADGSRLSAEIDIYTRALLQNGSKIVGDDVNSILADVVTWHGREYTVCSTEDWSAFGRGYMHAVCELLPHNPPKSP